LNDGCDALNCYAALDDYGDEICVLARTIIGGRVPLPEPVVNLLKYKDLPTRLRRRYAEEAKDRRVAREALAALGQMESAIDNATAGDGDDPEKWEHLVVVLCNAAEAVRNFISSLDEETCDA